MATITTVAVESAAFSIKEFCQRNGISAPTYYKLKNAGRGPKEMRTVGAKIVRITLEAEREWHRAGENPTGAEAEAIKEAAETMRQRASRMGTKAVASPRHVSRRGHQRSTGA